MSPTAKQHRLIGASVFADLEQRRARSFRSHETQDPLRPFKEIARLVLMRRSQLGLTQQDLAERMGTTKSVISRIESGQHRTSTDTLRRLAKALHGYAVIGFEFDAADPAPPELVRL